MEQPKAFYRRRSQLANLDQCQRYFSTNLPPVSLFITFIIDKSTRNLSIFKKYFIFWSLVKITIFEIFLQKKKLGNSKPSTEKLRFLNFELLWPCDLDRKLAGIEISSHVWEIFGRKRHWVAFTAWGDVISLGWNIFLRFQMQLKSEYQQFFVFSRAFLW